MWHGPSEGHTHFSVASIPHPGSSHKDTPDALLPACVSSGPTARMSQVYQEPPTIVCGPFYTKRSCDPLHMHM